MAWCWWCGSILSGHFSENNQEASHEGFWNFGPKIDQIPLKNSAEQTEFCGTHHAFFPYYRHPVLNTIHSIGNLGKIILPKSFLAAVESTVVRPCCGQVIAVIETHRRAEVGEEIENVRRNLPYLSLASWPHSQLKVRKPQWRTSSFSRLEGSGKWALVQSVVKSSLLTWIWVSVNGECQNAHKWYILQQKWS